MPLQIKDWDDLFESSESRKVKRCSYVCVPNKQDGGGFTELMALPDGLSIYGIFGLLAGAVSKLPPPRNGYLTSNARQDGAPWTTRYLAMRFHRKVEEFDRAFQVLSSPSVGWLLGESPGIPGEIPGMPGLSGRGGAGQDGTGQGGIAGDAADSPPSPEIRSKSAHTAFVTWYCQRWQHKHGNEYPFNGADAKAVKTILDSVKRNLDAAKEIARNYFDVDEPYFSGHPLKKLASEVARFSQRPKRGERGYTPTSEEAGELLK